MKERVKVFQIESSPTARGEQKNLAALIENQLNAFISQDHVESSEFTITTDLNSAFPKAVVVVKYLSSRPEIPPAKQAPPPPEEHVVERKKKK